MARECISIVFNENLTDGARRQALAAMNDVAGVFKASMLMPGEKEIAFAYTDGSKSAAQVAGDIRKIPGVKHAEIPPPRYLA